MLALRVILRVISDGGIWVMEEALARLVQKSFF
jgi:hypothetical protein